MHEEDGDPRAERCIRREGSRMLPNLRFVTKCVWTQVTDPIRQARMTTARSHVPYLKGQPFTDRSDDYVRPVDAGGWVDW